MKVFIAKLLLKVLVPNPNKLGSIDANGKVQF